MVSDPVQVTQRYENHHSRNAFPRWNGCLQLVPAVVSFVTALKPQIALEAPIPYRRPPHPWAHQHWSSTLPVVCIRRCEADMP